MAQHTARGKGAAVARVVVMLDIEFLTKRDPFHGTVFYRYRSGILRPAIFDLIRELSDGSGGICSLYESDDLALNWSNDQPFFPGIRICDLPAPQAARHLFKRLKPLLSTPPGEPTIILMRASAYNKGKFPGVQLVEEPIIAAENIADVLRYLANTSDLAEANEIVRQAAFQKYFRNWIKNEEKVGLPDLIKEFDRSILAYSEPDSSVFNPPTQTDLGPADRSVVVRALGQFLGDQDAPARAELLRAYALRKNRGWSDQEIADDLLMASRKVLMRCCSASGHSGPKAGWPSVSPEAAILWSALALMSANQIAADRPDARRGECLPILLELEHLCQDFEKRVADLADDPLAGRWSELREACRQEPDVGDDETVIDPRAALLRTMWVEGAKRHWLEWLNKLQRSAVARSTPADVVIQCGTDHADDLNNFGEVIGQRRIVEEIRRRFKEDQHKRPLLLSGPPGSGKRSLARLYAKSLLCENRPATSMDPCGSCVSCRDFSRSSSFGYFEFDMGRPDILEASREKLNEFRFQGFSARRAVLLKDPDRSDAATDAFLKTMETKNTISTYIVLAREERHVRAAALSRSARFRVQKLVGPDARRLLARWLPSDRIDSEVKDLIALHGDGRPGLMWHLSQLVMRRSAWTLAGAKALFDLEWGERTVRYLQALLGEKSEEAQALLQQIDSDPVWTVHHIRTVMYASVTQGAPSEAALRGLKATMTDVFDALGRRAAEQGIPREILWGKLAAHWLEDGVIDGPSLAAAGREADLIVRGVR